MIPLRLTCSKLGLDESVTFLDSTPRPSFGQVNLDGITPFFFQTTRQATLCALAPVATSESPGPRSLSCYKHSNEIWVEKTGVFTVFSSFRLDRYFRYSYNQFYMKASPKCYDPIKKTSAISPNRKNKVKLLLYLNFWHTYLRGAATSWCRANNE